MSGSRTVNNSRVHPISVGMYGCGVGNTHERDAVAIVYGRLSEMSAFLIIPHRGFNSRGVRRQSVSNPASQRPADEI